MNDIYVFLDWSMTISDLVHDGKIDEEKFLLLSKCLAKLEEKFCGNVKFFVVSGCTEDKAKRRSELLKIAFKKFGQEGLFCGFAFEYGGFFLDKDGKIFSICKGLKSSSRNKIAKIAKNFDILCDTSCKLYASFGPKPGEEKEFEDFVLECRKDLKGLSLVYFKDKEGYGLDIKESNHTKGVFVSKLLKKCPPFQLIIAGGDDAEDLSMLGEFSKVKKIFLGFGACQNLEANEVVFSDKENIEGVIDNLQKILN